MTELNQQPDLHHGLTARQLELLYGNEKSIEARFWKFHSENPKIYRKLVNLARVVRRRGYQHYSIDALFHRVRWHMTFEQKKPQEAFKLNDHYSSFYARTIMRQEPDLSDFFEIREQRSRKRSQ